MEVVNIVVAEMSIEVEVVNNDLEKGVSNFHLHIRL